MHVKVCQMLFIVISVFLLACPASAAWSLQGIPEGERFSAIAADTLPSDFPVFTVSVPNASGPALIFLGAIARGAVRYTYLTVLDESLTPVFYVRRPEGNSDFKRHPNGLITFFDNGVRCFYAMNSSFSVVDSFRTVGGYVTDGHDIQFTASGNVLLMSYDVDTVDMSVIVPGGNDSAAVTGLVLQELDAGKNLVFQWRSWDHFAITDAVYRDLTAATVDYAHGNAFDIDTDGNILLSSRHMDEITKIDRSTGAIIWRWGGKNNQFTFINDTLRFSYQHDVRRIANGNITLFDNGNYHVPSFSRAVEYALDEQAMTATLVWEFRDSMKISAPATGNVQRLPNGNTFISWGTAGIITEVRPDGTKAMEFLLPDSFTTYRTFRYGNAPTAVSPPASVPADFQLSAPYPNPFNGDVRIEFRLQRPSAVRMEIVNLAGQTMDVLIDEMRPVGRGSVSYNASLLASGIYFVRMRVDGRMGVRKMMVVR